MADPIGEIPVQIIGDASELLKALADAVKKSEDGAEKISHAFTQSFRGSEEAFKSFSASMGGFSTTADALINKQKELDAELIKARGALVEIKLAYDAGAVSINTLVRAQDEVAAAAARANVAFDESSGHVKSWGDSLKEFVQNPVQSSKDALIGMVESLGPLGVAAAAAAVGLVAAGKAIANLVLEAGAAAEKTSNFADKLNLSFNETRKLSDMADIAGVSVEGLARVSMRLADALADSKGSGKEVADALKSLGVSATESGPALLQMLQLLSEIPNATERISMAHKIMGRSAIELEPLLKDYAGLKTTIEELGGALSKEAIEKLKAADDAADKLGKSWRNFKEQIAATFSEPVIAGLNLLRAVLDKPSSQKLGEALGKKIMEVFDTATLSVAKATKQSEDYNAELDKSNKLNVIAGAAMEKQADAAFKRSEGYNKELDASNKLGEAAIKRGAAAAAKALSDWKRATNEMLSAQKAEVTHQEHINQLLADFGVKVGDPRIKQWTDRIQELNIEAMRGEISWNQFNSALGGFNEKLRKITEIDFAGILRDMEILGDKMDKAAKGGKPLENAFMQSAEAAGILKATLDNLGTPVAAEFMSMANAAKVLGISIGESGEATTKAISAIESYLRNSKDISEIELAWDKAGAALKRLAETNLPAYIKLSKEHIDRMKEAGKAQGEIYAQEIKDLDRIIRQKELAGKDATKEIIQMDQKIRKMRELSDAARRLGDMYVAIRHEFDKLFDARKLIDTLGGALFDTSKNKELEESIKGLNADLKEAALNWANVQREAATALEEIIADHAKAQARIQEDAARSFRDATIDYRRFVEDAREDLRKAQREGDAEEVREIQKQLRRRAEDYAIYVSDLKKATAQKLQDDKEAQAKETKAVQDNLAQQKVAYDQFVAVTTAKIVEMTDAMTNAFERMGNAFKETLKGFVTEVGKLVASTILQGYLDQLKKKIAGALFPDVGENGEVGGIAGGLISKIKGGLGGSSTSPVNVPGDMPPGGAVKLPGGAGGAAGGVGGLAGAVNMITGAVSAITDVLQFLQGRRMEQDIGRIEVTTRGMLNQLISLQGTFNTYLPAISDRTLGVWQELINVVEILRLMGQVVGGDGLGQQIADAINSNPHTTEVSDGMQALSERLQDGVTAANDYNMSLQTTASTAYELDTAFGATADGLYYFNEAVTGITGSLPAFQDGMDRAVFNSMAGQQGQPGQNLSPGGPRMNMTPFIMPVPVPDALTGPGGLMQGAMLPHENRVNQFSTIAPVVGGPGVSRGGSGAQIGNVYVTAVDPTSRSVTKGIVTGLEEVGIRVR